MKNLHCKGTLIPAGNWIRRIARIQRFFLSRLCAFLKNGDELKLSQSRLLGVRLPFYDITFKCLLKKYM